MARTRTRTLGGSDGDGNSDADLDLELEDELPEQGPEVDRARSHDMRWECSSSSTASWSKRRTRLLDGSFAMELMPATSLIYVRTDMIAW